MSNRLPTTGRGVTVTQHPPGSLGSGVFSFNTRTGNVTGQTGDYTAAQVTNAADKSSGSQQAFAGELSTSDLRVSGLAGANIQARLVGATTSGAPTSGTFAQGDLVVDLSGQLWVCTTAGSPGTWGNAGTSAGVSAFNSRSGAVSPTAGDYTAAQVTNAADTNSSSQQVFTAEVKAKDFAIAGLTGATQASRIVGATASGAPTTGTFAVGDVVVDRMGGLWVCTGAGTPGTWVAPGASMSAGTYYKPIMIEGSGASSMSPVANTLYVAQISIPTRVTLTGIEFRITVGTINILVSLYNATGTRVAVSSIVAAPSGVGRLPFTGTYSAAGGTYFIGMQAATGASVYGGQTFGPCAALAQGSLAAPSTITPPTIPTGSSSPTVCTY